MNEKIEFTSPQEKISEQRQARFDSRVIETLLGNFRDIESKAPAQDKQVLIEHLFKTENIKTLLESQGVMQRDDLSTIISKLETTLLQREREKTLVRPSEEEQVQAVNDNEQDEIRAEIMNFQEEINELYRLNNEATDEDERLQSALAYLEIFNAHKNGNEPVKVVRTQGGTVQVVFEEDLQDRKALHELSLDIPEVKKRLSLYEKELATLSAEGASRGLLGKFFGKSPSLGNEGKFQEEQEKWKGEISRTEMALAEIFEKSHTIEERLHNREEEKERALREPLLVSGLDEFSGTWADLRDQIQKLTRETREVLREGITDREQRIKKLETGRDNLENPSQAA